jgi:hypothetical protein
VQLAWCASARVRRAVFTHCGSEIIRGRRSHGCRRRLRSRFGARARVAIARDGLELTVG